FLDGGTGADTLAGGTGDDTYLVDNAAELVIEQLNEGTDTVYSSVTYSLSGYASLGVENLTLAGAAPLDGYGNSLDNVLTGNSANNKLSGSAGADTLIGGQGDDTLLGGDGDDTLDGGGGADAPSGGAGNDPQIARRREDSV